PSTGTTTPSPTSPTPTATPGCCRRSTGGPRADGAGHRARPTVAGDGGPGTNHPMSLLRYLPRAMIGASFISSGVSTLRATADTGPPTDADGEPFGADGPSPDDEQVQKAAAAVKVAAGSLLLLNKLPRLSALALAGTLAPGMAAQPFWEMDGDRRQQAMQQFMRHLGMAGGLLITAMDTQGRPGLAWRAGHAVEHAGTQIAHTRRE